MFVINFSLLSIWEISAHSFDHIFFMYFDNLYFFLFPVLVLRARLGF